ncbi:hypothetical protein NDU88_000351 [Pleurodeles waltl]|uniref:Uncharacterized protein n=1 Tax=Pleurodeles waltl TaxID=8319 RepID=A0AAV7V5J5_PLEWA|nr:hypothetical protein NDU88_000351 [Pleurodeles waltl]
MHHSAASDSQALHGPSPSVVHSSLSRGRPSSPPLRTSPPPDPGVSFSESAVPKYYYWARLGCGNKWVHQVLTPVGAPAALGSTSALRAASAAVKAEQRVPCTTTRWRRLLTNQQVLFISRDFAVPPGGVPSTLTELLLSRCSAPEYRQAAPLPYERGDLFTNLQYCRVLFSADSLLSHQVAPFTQRLIRFFVVVAQIILSTTW